MERMLIPFVEGLFPIPVEAKKSLELEAQAASEEAVRRDQDDGPVTGRNWDVALCEQVPHVGLNLDAAQENIRERLPDLHAQIGIEVVQGLAVRILL